MVKMETVICTIFQRKKVLKNVKPFLILHTCSHLRIFPLKEEENISFYSSHVLQCCLNNAFYDVPEKDAVTPIEMYQKWDKEPRLVF